MTEPPSAALCIPVRNEATLLPVLIAALSAQRDAAVAFTACFFLDGCTDGSEAVLRSAAGGLHGGVRIVRGAGEAPNAGRARRAAMAIGLAAIGDAPGAILLTTDADSRPHPDWVAAAAAALAHADVAAGRILRDTAGDAMQDRVEYYYDRLHAYRRAVDPVPWDVGGGSHCSGGANLAIRVSAYRALGGFKPIASGEDATLLDDAARAGFRVRRDPAMIVETSSRREGRAPGGLAAALREIDRRGEPRVPHPAAAAWQYRAQAAARRAFARVDDLRVSAGLGRTIGLSADHVVGVARDCPNAEAFAMRIVPAAPGGAALVPLGEAEQALAALERIGCEAAA